jgi:AcrR family transcriptional regulator
LRINDRLVSIKNRFAKQGPSMPRKADPNRRQAIIQAASRVFAQKGYTSTRIIEVAQAAAVGKGTIYEYFRSKEALFFAVFESMMEASTEILAQAGRSAGESFSQRIQHLSENIIQSWLGQLDMYALVMEFWAATASSPSRESFKTAFQDGYKELRAIVGDLIRDAQHTSEIDTDIDADKVAAALIGTWDALLLQAWLDPQFDALATSRSFMAVVLRGLGVHHGQGDETKVE